MVLKLDKKYSKPWLKKYWKWKKKLKEWYIIEIEVYLIRDRLGKG